MSSRKQRTYSKVAERLEAVKQVSRVVPRHLLTSNAAEAPQGGSLTDEENDVLEATDVESTRALEAVARFRHQLSLAESEHAAALEELMMKASTPSAPSACAATTTTAASSKATTHRRSSSQTPSRSERAAMGTSPGASSRRSIPIPSSNQVVDIPKRLEAEYPKFEKVYRIYSKFINDPNRMWGRLEGQLAHIRRTDLRLLAKVSDDKQRRRRKREVLARNFDSKRCQLLGDVQRTLQEIRQEESETGAMDERLSGLLTEARALRSQAAKEEGQRAYQERRASVEMRKDAAARREAEVREAEVAKYQARVEVTKRAAQEYKHRKRRASEDQRQQLEVGGRRRLLWFAS
eukprot:GHVU01109056.1.p1 GENE.GHVU01109056.1~~GHVU01109056.1.p1  ORF type:complete len:349 (+),score=53.78 GHVU01109056.1:122-1168(+)